MFFGNKKINRKSCSEEKKVEGKIIYFYGLESGLGNARRKTFQGCAQIYRQEERVLGSFRRFSTIFLEFFYNFLEFSAIFLENFSKNFCNFFRLLRFPYDFSENFSENSRSQSVTVRPGLAIIVSLQLSLQVSLHLYL